MKFFSTRGASPALDFLGALRQGLAPDGGLYVPARFPLIGRDLLNSEHSTIHDVGEAILSCFISDQAFKNELRGICERAFDFPIPLVPLEKETGVLELFHGPTSAFKDVGARFLAEASAVAGQQSPGLRTVLVATSGDTGGAVAAAFYGRPDFEVIVLFPKGRISPRQEKQLTCWGGNIRAYAVKGTFDDCQRMAKEAFLDSRWRIAKSLTSANSINIGRILPQAIYYAWASLTSLRETGKAPGFIVPSGNLGNSVGALWAKKMGFPISQVVLACNSNRAVSDFLASGNWEPRPTIATLANAMDVGNPSNIERIRHLYPDLNELRSIVQCVNVDDHQIRTAIAHGEKRWGRIWCPHSATAAFARESLSGGPWILVSTAHPAKFEEVVEPVIGKALKIPPALARCLAMPSRVLEIDSRLADLPLN